MCDDYDEPEAGTYDGPALESSGGEEDEQHALNKSLGHRNLYVTIAITCLVAVALILANNVDPQQYRPPEVPGMNKAKAGARAIDRSIELFERTADSALDTVDQMTDRLSKQSE